MEGVLSIKVLSVVASTSSVVQYMTFLFEGKDFMAALLTHNTLTSFAKAMRIKEGGVSDHTIGGLHHPKLANS